MITVTTSELKTFFKIASKIKKDEFNTSDLYSVSPDRSQGALRRELQALRDNGIIQFLGNGEYKKVGNVW
ncbi:hypothetical protein PQC39_gp008 [Vibrio phage Vp_R1]|uniref:Dam-replacing protein HTH domain-containing protein n=1 Tax=Vibrio phage Vp_R1 TaxID=2059867 RepID=A0A2H5BPW5_9CAUD|nr:hypothetical protein PQC39_gp008 [Vibrio phage Vp_R1]AUG88372.1 hypothetical protein VPR_008 [Vibrio phage Vp_R1]